MGHTAQGNLDVLGKCCVYQPALLRKWHPPEHFCCDDLLYANIAAEEGGTIAEICLVGACRIVCCWVTDRRMKRYSSMSERDIKVLRPQENQTSTVFLYASLTSNSAAIIKMRLTPWLFTLVILQATAAPTSQKQGIWNSIEKSGKVGIKYITDQSRT